MPSQNFIKVNDAVLPQRCHICYVEAVSVRYER